MGSNLDKLHLLKTKLIVSSVLLIAMFMVFGVLSWLTTRSTETMGYFDHEQMYVQMMLRGINEIIITEGTPQSIAILKAGIDGFDANHSMLLKTVSKDEIANMNERITTPWVAIKGHMGLFLQRDLDTEDTEVLIAYGKTITKNAILRNTPAILAKAKPKST